MRSITTWTFKEGEPFNLARRFADLEGTSLLYSGTALDSADSSYLCLFPEKKINFYANKTCWEELKTQLGSFDPNDLPIPCWIGYIGYEMGCFADPDKTIPTYSSKTPDCCFYAPSVVIHFEHTSNKATLYSKSNNISLERKIKFIKKSNLFKLIDSSDNFQSYLTKIKKVKKLILEGEIYQINLSQEIHLTGDGDPFELFEKMNGINPAPFSSFIKSEPFSIICTSPERFLCRRKDILQTRPIKGTAPRGKCPKEDRLNYHKLLTSEKEKAELLMITDLMRNDLGKIATPGSIYTKDIWRCESYTNVFHLLSIIEGKIECEKNPVEILQALFPGGSITGCPKLRAMEIIANLEKRPRGIYTGSIGYFAANGDFDFNIAIRTLIVHSEYIQLQLGGAIVIDSDPIQEFEETLHKGRSLFSALGIEDLSLVKKVRKEVSMKK